MKQVALLLLPFITSCASLSGGGDGAGAESPSAAIQQFLTAARRKDLPAMANVWGTEKGPASKALGRQELERRELIMIQCLAHEQATLGASTPGEAGRLRIPVELTLVTLKARPAFTVVKGPGGRWFVQDLEIAVLRDGGFCGATAGPPGAAGGAAR
ncbi:MAG: hypothetical protein FJ363_06050 [Gemmatimonadetes bacterium]|nr:hypothetical protein [Gemmatimonadota bacterium]